MYRFKTFTFIYAKHIGYLVTQLGFSVEYPQLDICIWLIDIIIDEYIDFFINHLNI